MSDKNKYNLTMLLPKTDFGMRGKLPTEEVKMMEFWNNIELWKKLREKSEAEFIELIKNKYNIEYPNIDLAFFGSNLFFL